MSLTSTLETITAVHTWVPGKLFSFRCTRPAQYRFVPGQFARLGLPTQAGADGPPDERWVWRAYSIVSAAYDDHLEFFSIVVPDGAFTSRLADLRVGDRLAVDNKAQGFLTTDRFTGGEHLWMLSSGTGLAPFLSILQDPDTWQRYQKIILVHCVRHGAELAYAEWLQRWLADLPNHPLFESMVAEFGHEHLVSHCQYLPVVTRERWPGALGERLPALIKNGGLEQAVGLPLSLDKSRILLCGNPSMVDETRSSLKDKGFSMARRHQMGQIAVENYW